MKNTQQSYDMDELGQELRDHVEERSKANMPAAVQVQIIDGSMQLQTGWVWGQINDRNVRVMVFAPSDYTGATAANPYTVWALPPNEDSPTSPYIALGVAYVGADVGGFGIGRVPPIITPGITDPDGNPMTGSGSVTSVAMTVPAFLSVAGSPITTSGTLAVTLATESANAIFAGPTSGGDATPTFRSLVAADIPDISATYIPKSIIDAKGDILAGTADNTPARVPVGANGTVLTADSTQAAGVKWGTGSGGIPESIIDAKGDLIAGTAADTAARVGVGSNGTVLTADSSQSAGIKWATGGTVVLSDVTAWIGMYL